MKDNGKDNKIIDPINYLSIIEKRIRKNPKIAKLFANSDKISVLTFGTSDIANSVYLTSVKGNKTILDILLEKYGNFFSPDELEKRVKENNEILEIYLKNNVNPITSNSTCEFSLTKIYGNTLLEYVMEYMKFDDMRLEEKIESNEQICNIVFNYFMKKSSLDVNQKNIVKVLIKKLSNDDRLELYKKHFKNIKEFMSDSSFENTIISSLDSKTIKLLTDMGEYEILKKINNNGGLFLKREEKDTLLRILLQKNIGMINEFYCSIGELLKALIENKMYEKVERVLGNNYENIIQNGLLKKYDVNNTFFDDLLTSANYCDLDFRSSKLWKEIQKSAYNNINVAKMFLKYDNWERVLNANDSILNSKYDDETTIFEYLISKIKKCIETGHFLPFTHLISKKILLYKYNDRTILEEMLLKIGKIITLHNIHRNKLDSDIDIQTILRLNGVDIKKEFGIAKFDISDVLSKQKNEIMKNKYAIHSRKKISVEQQELLNELRSVFQEDGRSDEEIINLACNSFESLFLNNYEYAERDLISLINIKHNNPEFVLKKGNSDCFDNLGRIMIGKIYNIDSFNHELTHAIHWYALQYKNPESFNNLKIEINEEKFSEFLSTFVLQERELIGKVEKNCDFYNKNYNAKEDSKKLEKRMKEILDESEKNNLYSYEIIDYLKNNIPIQEEYKKYYNRVALVELCKVYQENYLYSIISIVDALKKGKIYDKGIENGRYFYKIGHGSNYFTDDESVFNEVIATYNEIIKSKHREKAVKILESIVGHELFEVLDEFNKELVVESFENRKQK